jgi:hypothetical protein
VQEINKSQIKVSLLVHHITRVYTETWWLQAHHGAKSSAHPVALDDLPDPVNRGEGGCAAKEHLQGKPDPKVIRCQLLILWQCFLLHWQ